MNKQNLLWIEQHTVQASDTDFLGRAKLSYVLDVMQRAADAAVNGQGLSLEKMLEAGMGWMLITLDLEFRRVPRPNEQLAVHTWSKGTKGAVWQRDYRIFTAEAAEVAVARSIWALVDIHKRKMLRPSALPESVEHYTADSVGASPDKVQIPPDLVLEEVYRYEVKYSGLDNNGHLNNARYGDLCCDVFSLQEWGEAELKQFRITYLHEAKFGDELVILRSGLTDEGVYVRGQGRDFIAFEACLRL
ncbi:acyl-[acyl-carrier-protein] thioesterase [Paenibacillus donghaensis]|uniref:Acyl-ACP thioesterase n=1 Tax=Paenibacillus donghaensis TaxID=414771 RepID=A0A2Z2KH67_9BACL|nr:acyl-ACP thioesterase domain-containing protein [Paenibacillus donghaensis]ASA25574.1 hypothetical protein B9T62_35500 [Paenibacillus donghaensis]